MLNTWLFFNRALALWAPPLPQTLIKCSVCACFTSSTHKASGFCGLPGELGQNLASQRIPTSHLFSGFRGLPGEWTQLMLIVRSHWQEIWCFRIQRHHRGLQEVKVEPIILAIDKLSNPSAKKCKEQSISTELPKLTKTSRCGGVASAFSIKIGTTEMGKGEI